MVDRKFDIELDDLNCKLIKMATLTEDSIRLSIEALKNRDKELAKKVIEDDRVIDALELEIDDFSIELLAKRQPLAGELRFVTTGIKINAELERIADLAGNIAHRAIDLSELPEFKPLVNIPLLSEHAINMVKSTMEAYVKKDCELADKVIKMDAKANELRTAIQKKLVADYMSKDISNLTRGLSLFLVAQHLERICDHAKYIAEAVIFLVCARVVKHSKLKCSK